jgi:hypothetical protein
MDHEASGVVCNRSQYCGSGIRRVGALIAATAVIIAVSLVQSASAQTITLESWENTLDGWTFPQNPGYVNSAFSTKTGVTDGTYSLALTMAGTSGPNYGQLLLSSPVLAWTAALAVSSNLSLDVFTPASSFGFFLQFDIDINNPDTGFQSLDGFSYPSTVIGSETTITVPISQNIRSELLTSTNATQIAIQVGGGFSAGNETMFLDNLRVNGIPEPSTFALLGLGLLGLFGMRRRVS